jgi:multidrug resistance protein, MATE family
MPLVRRVLRLGTWVMLAMITQFFVNYADTLMVGRLEGPEATASQAALGLGMPLFWAVGGFFAAMGAGTQAMVGRRYAQGDYEGAGKVLFNALVIGVIAGTIGTIFGYWVTSHGISFLATASEEQKLLGTTYCEIRMLGIFGMVLTFGYKAFFDGIGVTSVHLWAAMAMNVCNIVLNYLLIYGYPPLGIPRLALAGAGIASTIATYMGLVIMMWTSFKPKYSLKYRFYQLRHRDWSIVGRIFKLMLPTGSATVILMTGFALFMRFVGDIDQVQGTNTLSAATKAIMDTTALCFMPMIAFGTATATCVSQSLGAGKPNLAARYGWESARVGVLAMIVLGTIFFVFPVEIISLLSPNDPAVAEAGALSLRIVTSGLPLMAVGLVLSQALFGAGANTFVAGAEFLLHFGILVPGAWLMGPVLGYGLEGIWLAATLYVNLLGLVMALKFLGQGWRQIRL